MVRSRRKWVSGRVLCQVRDHTREEALPRPKQWLGVLNSVGHKYLGLEFKPDTHRMRDS